MWEVFAGPAMTNPSRAAPGAIAVAVSIISEFFTEPLHQVIWLQLLSDEKRHPFGVLTTRTLAWAIKVKPRTENLLSRLNILYDHLFPLWVALTSILVGTEATAAETRTT